MKHVGRLEVLIAESFNLLLRKARLARNVRIDLESFRIDIIDASGNVILPERLSAGERQLLVVAILWGLAKASGRPIPTVIDTPLSRLDGRHRANLVNHYFPAASHQVVLLSTDQEIDQEHFETLGERITRAYRIEYEEDEQTSAISDGYFWKGAA